VNGTVIAPPTILILFKPFSLKKWLFLVLIAYLAGGMGGGGNGSGGGGSSSRTKESEAWAQESPYIAEGEDLSEEEIFESLKVKHAKGKGTRVVASTVPVITHLEPDFGRPGTEIVVHGENFLPGQVEVLFGETFGREATYLTSTTIGVRAPYGEGEVDITVINSDGQEGVLEDGFIFIPNPPKFEDVVPREGPDSGGTVVDVYGEFMSYVKTVTFGTTNLTGTPEIIDAYHIRFTTEAMAPGTYTLTLTDRFGQSVREEDAFEFVAAPVLLTVSPERGGAGRSVTCGGMNFRPDHVVLVNGVPWDTVYLSDTALQWVTPPGLPGDKLTVGVRDIWGRTSTLPELFEYAYSYGVFDEPFSSNDLEDTDFVPSNGGIAKWNPLTDPGKLVATFGNVQVNAPFSPAQQNPAIAKAAANSIPKMARQRNAHNKDLDRPAL